MTCREDKKSENVVQKAPSRLRNHCKIIFAALLFLVVMISSLGCTPYGNDFGSYEELLAAAAENGKPVLLYISKTQCPYCNKFKSEWLNAKKEYGDKVYFYVTTRDKDKEAAGLYTEFSRKFSKVNNSPALIWIKSDGTPVKGISGWPSVKDAMWEVFEDGLEGWWQND